MTLLGVGETTGSVYEHSETQFQTAIQHYFASHVVLGVRDLGASRAFYADTLGISRQRRGFGGALPTWFWRRPAITASSCKKLLPQPARASHTAS